MIDTLDNYQMELSLNQRLAHGPTQRERRQNRANWWFRQMHRVVAVAREWTPAPPARPEQVHMKLHS